MPSMRLTAGSGYGTRTRDDYAGALVLIKDQVMLFSHTLVKSSIAQQHKDHAAHVRVIAGRYEGIVVVTTEVVEV